MIKTFEEATIGLQKLLAQGMELAENLDEERTMSKTAVTSEPKVKTSHNLNDAKLVSIRKGDLECRLWNIKDYPDNHNPEAELVKWDRAEGKEPTCYTCAIWDKDDEGWAMRSVGSRFFESADKNLMSLCKTFDYILNNLYLEKD